MNEITNNKVNLCDSCSQVYPDCTSRPENVYFGDGIGHDNICACSEYRPKTCGDGDTISRQDTVDVIASMIAYHKTLDDAYWYVKDDAPSAQPQLEICPIYGGMCGYPSNLCYECPRHGGAHEKPLWWTAGLQPFAQPKRTEERTETRACDSIGRQDAIDALKSLEFRQYMEFGEYIGEDIREVCLIRAEKAQDALQSLPSAQPKSSESKRDLSDTISRQAAMQLANDLQIPIDGYHLYNQAINNYCAEIGSLSEAIVRCKDCKHMEEDKIFHQCWCNGNMVKLDDYCSHAERKENVQ